MKISRRMKKRSKKAGMPPGSLVHIGEHVPGEIKVTMTCFDENGVRETEVTEYGKCVRADGAKVTWINVAGVQDADIIRKIGQNFNLHPLTLEDIMNTDHMAKANNFGAYVFIIMKAFVDDPATPDVIDSRQVSLILGRDYVISFQETSEDMFGPVRDRLRVDFAKFAAAGAGYLAYSLMDVVIDHYFVALEKLDDEIYKLEETTVVKTDNETLQLIQALRRMVIQVRRAAWPLREMIGFLEKRGEPFFDQSHALYLSDVYDHVVQVIDMTETFREVLSNVFDIYLTSISNKINEVMKVLAVIATVIMPMTVVTGMYGMNFQHMPELKWQYGYPFAIFLMAAIAVVMLSYFRRKKWF
jgi:magnesium transporter